MDLRYCTKAALLPLKSAFMRCFDVFMPFFTLLRITVKYTFFFSLFLNVMTCNLFYIFLRITCFLTKKGLFVRKNSSKFGENQNINILK